MTVTGTWITIDPANTSIDPDTGLATCLNVTPTPAQIRFEKTTFDWNYDFATLTCNERVNEDPAFAAQQQNGTI